MSQITYPPAQEAMGQLKSQMSDADMQLLADLRAMAVIFALDTSTD